MNALLDTSLKALFRRLSTRFGRRGAIPMVRFRCGVFDWRSRVALSRMTVTSFYDDPFTA